MVVYVLLTVPSRRKKEAHISLDSHTMEELRGCLCFMCRLIELLIINGPLSVDVPQFPKYAMQEKSKNMNSFLRTLTEYYAVYVSSISK